MYRRRRYRSNVKKAKYENQTNTVGTNWALANANAGVALNIIPSTDVSGTRKVKNFELQFQYEKQLCPVAYALVYVPEGTNPNALELTTLSVDPTQPPTSLYEPNQNVIMSGILPIESQAITKFRTRLARNLNSGDSIYLVLRHSVNITGQGEPGAVIAQCNFAICY